MQLFTGRYQRFRPDQGAPVRTTVGAPRFRLPYEIAGEARLLMPSFAMLKLDEEPYRAIYRERLETGGVDAIRRQLRTIAVAAGASQLVLLCFCDLTVAPPNNWCHRRMFAQWWQERTGEEVTELAEQVPPSLFD
ncbi:hypothetical protein ACQEVC_34470 [Plantactinospora sp. CA-294935]|uniref:hypothetical protein n=1 Tax=Plantactinospora sp. CA-294935 TaxID=3240012 RepID=UPI003D9106B6